MWQIERWHEKPRWMIIIRLRNPSPNFHPIRSSARLLLPAGAPDCTTQSTRIIRCSRLRPTFDARESQWRRSNSYSHTRFDPEKKVYGVIACPRENFSLQNDEPGVGKATAAGKLIILIIACLHFHLHFRWPHFWRYLQVFRSLELFWWSLTSAIAILLDCIAGNLIREEIWMENCVRRVSSSYSASFISGVPLDMSLYIQKWACLWGFKSLYDERKWSVTQWEFLSGIRV